MKKLLAALTVLSTATMASASLIAYDGFNYDATGNPVLGTGMGNWASVGNGAPNEPVLTSGSLSYPGLPASVGNSILLNNNSVTPGANASRLSLGILDSATTPTLYYSFVVSLPASTSTNSGGAYFAGFDNLTAGTFTTFAGLFVRRDSTDPAKSGTGDDNKLELGISTSGSANKVFGSTAYDSDEPLFVVGSFTFGGVSTLDVFANPDAIPAAEPGTHTISSSGVDASTVTQIKNFYVRGNVSEPNLINIDEVRVGTTWGDVAPIPEPASLGFVTAGCLGLLARRKRR